MFLHAMTAHSLLEAVKYAELAEKAVNKEQWEVAETLLVKAAGLCILAARPNLAIKMDNLARQARLNLEGKAIKP